MSITRRIYERPPTIATKVTSGSVTPPNQASGGDQLAGSPASPAVAMIAASPEKTGASATSMRSSQSAHPVVTVAYSPALIVYPNGAKTSGGGGCGGCGGNKPALSAGNRYSGSGPVSPIAQGGFVKVGAATWQGQLTVQHDSNGEVSVVDWFGPNGVHRQLVYTGTWPNQEMRFLENGATFFHVQTHLLQTPVSTGPPFHAVIGNYIFYCTLSNNRVSISYGVVPSSLSKMLGFDAFGRPNVQPFAAVKSEPLPQNQTLWRTTAAARGAFEFLSVTFPGIETIDVKGLTSIPTVPGAIFSRPPNGAPLWDVSIEGNFADELERASVFAPSYPGQTSQTVPPVAEQFGGFIGGFLGGCFGGGGAGLTLGIAGLAGKVALGEAVIAGCILVGGLVGLIGLGLALDAPPGPGPNPDGGVPPPGGVEPSGTPPPAPIKAKEEKK